MPDKKLYGFLLLFAAVLIYSCTSNIKYPEYKSGSSYKPTPSIHKKSKKAEIKTNSGIYYLKIHQCRKAVNYFRSLRSSFAADYCIFSAYGYCSMYKKAKMMFEKLENENVSNMWLSRLYAAFGFFSMINNKGMYRDYLTIAYAYDGNNKLARSLMLKRKINDLDRKKYFNTILDWCGGK